MTQQEIILNTLNDTGTWVSTHDLVQRRTMYGYIGTHGDKRLRELRKMGKVEDRTVPGTNFKEWRLKPKEKPEDRYRNNTYKQSNQMLGSKFRNQPTLW